MLEKNIQEYLEKGISNFDVGQVQKAIEEGADVNNKQPRTLYKGVAAYKYQPYSPLRLVVFRISDSDLSDEDLEKYIQITQLLLQAGADAGAAMKLATIRYGKYNPSLCKERVDENFYKVLDLIYEAHSKSKKATDNISIGGKPC